MMADEPTLLEAQIRDRIAREGPITVAEFMRVCLYDRQHGYYGRRAALGAAGDFVTAPEISQMFDAVIGVGAGET
jgi:SAM-dependent MidA family methyltransferase